MPLLKDLITIPERVHQGDFVLKLSEGVSHADATLRDYVVTPQLVRCFDNALGFIQQAVRTRQKQGSLSARQFRFRQEPLHGGAEPAAEPATRRPLDPRTGGQWWRAHAWTEGKKFLLVPYHMIGARDMESPSSASTPTFVRSMHPDAPVPGFYLAEGLFRDARRLRERHGRCRLLRQAERRGAARRRGGRLGRS